MRANRADARLRAGRSHLGRVAGIATRPAVIDKVSRRAVAERTAQCRSLMTPRTHSTWYASGHRSPACRSRITRGGEVLAPREIGAIELRGPTVAENYLTADGVVPLASTTVGSTPETWDTSTRRGDSMSAAARRISSCWRAGTCIRTISSGRRKVSTACERVRDRAACRRRSRGLCGARRSAATQTTRTCALRISREIAARVSRHVGHLPRHVLLFPAGALPKTPSGKLRRNSARELLPT